MTFFINKMKKHTLIKIWALASALMFSLSGATVSAMTPPEVVVQQTIDAALSELTQRREEFKADPAELYVAIERHLEPVVHFERLSKLVLAKNWRKASEEQRIEFIHYFKKTLLNTYSSALFEYSGEKIVYKPVADKYLGKDKVRVETEFVSNTGDRIPVIYSMSNRKDDKWRAYDIKIVMDGASTSLVQLYKSQYNSIVAKKGIEGLINDLKSKDQ